MKLLNRKFLKEKQSIQFCRKFNYEINRYYNHKLFSSTIKKIEIVFDAEAYKPPDYIHVRLIYLDTIEENKLEVPLEYVREIPVKMLTENDGKTRSGKINFPIIEDGLILWKVNFRCSPYGESILQVLIKNKYDYHLN